MQPTQKACHIEGWPGRSREAAQSLDQPREYYTKDFADYRRKKPTPYMLKLCFTSDNGGADCEVRMLPDKDFEKAMREGKERG